MWVDNSALINRTQRPPFYYACECACEDCQKEWWHDYARLPPKEAAATEDEVRTKRWMAMQALYRPKPKEKPEPDVEYRRRAFWSHESDEDKVARFEADIAAGRAILADMAPSSSAFATGAGDGEAEDVAAPPKLETEGPVHEGQYVNRLDEADVIDDEWPRLRGPRVEPAVPIAWWSHRERTDWRHDEAAAPSTAAEAPAPEPETQPAADDEEKLDVAPAAPIVWWYFLTAEEEEEGPFDSLTVCNWIIDGQVPPYLLLRTADAKGKYTPIGTLVSPGGALEASLEEATRLHEADKIARQTAEEARAAAEAVKRAEEAVETRREYQESVEREAHYQLFDQAARDHKRLVELDAWGQMAKLGFDEATVEAYFRNLPSGEAVKVAEAAAEQAKEQAKAKIEADMTEFLKAVAAKEDVRRAARDKRVEELYQEEKQQWEESKEALLAAREAREADAVAREENYTLRLGFFLREALDKDPMAINIHKLEDQIAHAKDRRLDLDLINAAKHAWAEAVRAQRLARGELRRGPEWPL